MDSQESALVSLFVIFALIAAVAYVVRILGSKEEEKESSDILSETKYEPPKPPVRHSTGEKAAELTGEKTEQKKFVTVYRFSVLRSSLRCPHCDAENPENAILCQICGSEIS